MDEARNAGGCRTGKTEEKNRGEKQRRKTDSPA
jgi:hypothetical protein